MTEKKVFEKPTVVIVDYNDLLSPLYDIFTVVPFNQIMSKDPKFRPIGLIIWNDILQMHKDLVMTAQRYGVPTFVVQHGRGAMRDYFMEGKDPAANAVFVWGQNDVMQAVNGGWPEDHVFRIGSPLFYYRPDPKKIKKEKGLVVFDAPHWDCEIPEGYEVWDKLNEVDGITPVAKLLHGQAHSKDHYYGYSVTTDRSQPGHIKTTYDLVAKAECLVTMVEGTLPLMAYSLDVPVVFARGLKKRKLLGHDQSDADYEPSPAAYSTSIEKMGAAVKFAMSEPERRRKERSIVTIDEMGDPMRDTPYRMISQVVRTMHEYRLKHAKK